jgi:hypothetical protein
MFGERSSMVFVFDIAIGRFFLLNELLALIAGTCRGCDDDFGCAVENMELMDCRGSIADRSTLDL